MSKRDSVPSAAGGLPGAKQRKLDKSVVDVTVGKEKPTQLTTSEWLAMWSDYLQTCSAKAFVETFRFNTAKDMVVSATEIRAVIAMRRNQGIEVSLQNAGGYFSVPLILACTGCTTTCSAKLNPKLKAMDNGDDNHEAAGEHLDVWRLQMDIEHYVVMRQKYMKDSKEWTYCNLMINSKKRVLRLLDDSPGLQSFISECQNPKVWRSAKEYDRLALLEAGEKSSLRHTTCQKREKQIVWNLVLQSDSYIGMYVEKKSSDIDFRPDKFILKIEDRSIITRCDFLPSKLTAFFKHYDMQYKGQTITTLTVPATELTEWEQRRDADEQYKHGQLLINAMLFFGTLDEDLQKNFNTETLKAKYNKETLEQVMQQHNLYEEVCAKSTTKANYLTKLVDLVKLAQRPVDTKDNAHCDRFKDCDEMYTYLSLQTKIEDHKEFMRGINSSAWSLLNFLVPPAYNVYDRFTNIGSMWKTRVKDLDDPDNESKASFFVRMTSTNAHEARNLANMSCTLEILKCLSRAHRFHKRQKKDPLHFGDLQKCFIDVRERKQQFQVTIIVAPSLIQAKELRKTKEVVYQTKFPLPFAMAIVVPKKSHDESDSSDSDWSCDSMESEDVSSVDDDDNGDEEEEHEPPVYSDDDDDSDEDDCSSDAAGSNLGTSNEILKSDCSLESVEVAIKNATNRYEEMMVKYEQAKELQNKVDMMAYEAICDHLQLILDQLTKDKNMLVTANHAEDDDDDSDEDDDDDGDENNDGDGIVNREPDALSLLEMAYGGVQ